MHALSTLRIGLLLLCSVAMARSALAQVDLSGEWSSLIHEDVTYRTGAGGAEVGDLSGLPFNDAGRLRVDSWSPMIKSAPEHQCEPHVATYSFFGPATLRITKEVDPVNGEVNALKVYGTYGRATRTIWLDGRPHPSELAAHTWAGFATGTWAGNMLTVNTTHIKAGWIQRNGGATSDRATITDHYVRNGDYLTIISLVNDPVYLEEPFIRSTHWVLNPSQQLGGTYYCTPKDVVDEGVAPGEVPHFLPGKNLAEQQQFSLKHGFPSELFRGGAASLYPEFAISLREKMPAARKAQADWNQRQLTPAKARAIRARAAAGTRRQQLARDFGISIGTVYEVIANRIYPESEPVPGRTN